MKEEREKRKGKLRVALTQSRGRLEIVQELLEQRGFEVVRQPLIETRPLLDEKTRLEAEKLLECAWILFTSRTAAETWQQLSQHFSKGFEVENPTDSFVASMPGDFQPRIYPLATPNIGAVGKKTAEALQQIGVKVAIIADSQNAENFADMFLNHSEAKSPVGLPQGDKALDTVQKKLEQAGFEVRPLVVYKTILQPHRFENTDVIVCSSPSAVEAIETIGSAKLVAIGATTQKAIEARGWQAIQSASPEAASIVEAVELVSRNFSPLQQQP